MTEEEPFLSGIAGYQPRRVACGVKLVLDNLEPERRAILVGYIDNEAVSAGAISEELRKYDVRLPAGTIARHRRRECRCRR